MKSFRSSALLIALIVVSLVGAEALATFAYAQSQPAGTIVLAQNDQGPGGFFRRLFRRNAAPPPPRESPFQLFPGFDAPEAAPPPRRDRRQRANAPAAPREVAAVEKAANAKRALVLGDFMAGALAKGLADAFRDNPHVVVIDGSSGSSGLVRNDYYDWTTKVAELVESQKPDAILMMIGGNDRQAMQTSEGSIAFGTDAWRMAYTIRVAALAEALKATGKPVLWGGLVPVESSAMSRDYSAFNGIVHEQLDAKGLRFVDMWNGFADEDGQYVAFGPDVSGNAVQLRADDGLNFTRAGQRKLAYFVEQPLNDLFGGAAPVLASVEVGSGAGAGEAQSPLIGPMVPFDALTLQGGNSLSGGVSRDARGDVSARISAAVTKPDATLPPSARADSFTWPLPEPPPPLVLDPLPQYGGPR